MVDARTRGKVAILTMPVHAFLELLGLEMFWSINVVRREPSGRPPSALVAFKLLISRKHREGCFRAKPFREVHRVKYI